MADISVTCSFLEIDTFELFTLQDELPEAILEKEWRTKANVDFAITSEHKLVCFILLLSFPLSDFGLKLSSLNINWCDYREKLLFFDFCTLIKVMQYS